MLSWMPLPSRTIVRERPLWLEILISTGPAPTLRGEIVTFAVVITPVNSSVTGGRGLFSKSFPLPQPARARAIARTAAAVRMAGRLTEPNGSPTRHEAVDFPLDLAPDTLRDLLDEREVFCVLCSICI